MMGQPIEVIAHCGADGTMEPLRFRYETLDHQLMRVLIDRVVRKEQITHVGAEALVFLCRATEEERQRLFELRYELRSHRWALQSIIY